MMAQEVGLAPTPVPPSIVTVSQSQTRDEQTEDNMYSEANNAVSQPRPDATDDNAFSEVIPASSRSRQQAVATAQTPERSRMTGNSETDEVQFFTETTQDLHTQSAGPAAAAAAGTPQAAEDRMSNAQRATPANLDTTAAPHSAAASADVAALGATAPPPLSSNGTPSFQVEEDDAVDNASEEAAEQRRAAEQSRPAEAVLEALAPPVPRTRGPGHTPRGARPDSGRPPLRPPSRTSSRYGTPRGSHGNIQIGRSTTDVPQAERVEVEAPRQQSLIPETQGSRTPLMPRASVAQSDRSIAFHVEGDATETGTTPTEKTPAQASRTPLMPRHSVAQSDRSIAFHVEDEVSDTASLAFQVEPAPAQRGRSEVSVDPTTTTDASDIHFNVVSESQASQQQQQQQANGQRGAVVESSVDPTANTDGSDIHFMMEHSRGSRPAGVADRAGTNSMTSLQFDIESTADNTRHSSISHFTVENDEPQPAPVQRAPQLAADDIATAAEPEEIVTESEERRRAQAAEEQRRKKALAERSRYMNTRPWDSNAPNPRARRTSSQAAAHTRDQQEAEKRSSAVKRRENMNARPWRHNMATPPKKTEVVEKKPAGAYERPWRVGMSTSPKKAAPAEPRPVDHHPWRTGMSATPKKHRPTSPQSPIDEAVLEKYVWAQQPQQQQQQRRASKYAPPTPSSQDASTRVSSVASSARRAPRDAVEPLLPVRPVFDTVEAAKFVTPAPVLKTPMQVLGEEVEGWSELVSQQRNLQAILDVMRTRERQCVRLTNQHEAQESAMQHLNKELYAVRDAHVRRYGTDVTGMPLHGRRETETGENGKEGAEVATAAAAAAAAAEEPDYTLLRLYPRQTHQATDYVALKQQRSGGATVSVLSDEDMSDGERDDFAAELASWRAERQSLRREKARLAHERRDLKFQMRRGSNIKDIKLTQPTSGRGPLDRRASGTETKVDIDGYDKLMDLRIASQQAGVEAANAKEQYENLCMIAATMRKQHDANSRELTDAEEVQEEAKERYEAVLQRIRAQIEEARPVIEKAQVTLRQRERQAMRSTEENAHAEVREYSDTILAVRLQLDRAAAMADAAGGDEERMRRASTPRIGGMSRTATPRGSISGSVRPGASPRGRANSASNNDVFARLTGRRSMDAQQNGVLAGTPMQASA